MSKNKVMMYRRKAISRIDELRGKIYAVSGSGFDGKTRIVGLVNAASASGFNGNDLYRAIDTVLRKQPRFWTVYYSLLYKNEDGVLGRKLEVECMENATVADVEAIGTKCLIDLWAETKNSSHTPIGDMWITLPCDYSSEYDCEVIVTAIEGLEEELNYYDEEHMRAQVEKVKKLKASEGNEIKHVV